MNFGKTCARQSIVIYKILTEAEWFEFSATKKFSGSAVDVKDGYIHFSTAQQVEATARKHFFDMKSLVLVAIDPTHLGDALKYEISRGGDLFPHYYATLTLTQIMWAKPLPLRDNGTHDFSGLLA